MASQTSKILVSFKAEDSQLYAAFKKIGRQSRTLEKNFTTLSERGIKRIRDEFNKMAKGSANSLQAMRAQKNALMGLRDQADITGLEFKQLTADIAVLDARMRQAGGGALGFKGKLKGFAKSAGAVAAGGIFGGPEGAIGAGIGAAVGGGPAGAAIGAAIGAQVGMVRQQLSGLAEYSAQLGLQRKALRLVIADTEKYAASQKFLADTSDKLAIPQDVITRQFTSLTASVIGAGQSVEDAQKVFEAIAAGIRGTGGSLEDMKAAMRATSQVFSKGKVSAEELRQQLGERLPGAFTLFADSMDKTPAQLDKALEQGSVTLDDFMGFADTLFKKYGENAEILADSPQAAGDRLRTEMSKLKDNLGQILEPIGADFQDTFAKITKKINEATGALRKFYKIGEEYQEEKLKELLAEKADIERQIKIYEKIIPTLQPFEGMTRLNKGQAINALNGLKQQLQEIEPKIAAIQLKVDNTRIATEKANKEAAKTPSILESIKNGATTYLESIKNVSKQIQDATVNAFKGMEDALVNFVTTGKLNFSDFAKSVIADLARIIVRASILNLFSGFSFFDKVTGKKNVKTEAYGDAFAQNGIVPYRKGGVVNSPTMFKYGGSNLGIMGEAGPEAILPLSRGKNGKLGVESSGGAGSIVVNVDASGSSVEGNAGQSKQFGRALAAAIQSEMIKQRRPGGLLT